VTSKGWATPSLALAGGEGREAVGVAPRRCHLRSAGHVGRPRPGLPDRGHGLACAGKWSETLPSEPPLRLEANARGRPGAGPRAPRGVGTHRSVCSEAPLPACRWQVEDCWRGPAACGAEAWMATQRHAHGVRGVGRPPVPPGRTVRLWAGRRSLPRSPWRSSPILLAGCESCRSAGRFLGKRRCRSGVALLQGLRDAFLERRSCSSGLLHDCAAARCAASAWFWAMAHNSLCD
jgi:hypothetical protein